ncbi:MAG TPA: DUF2497 domain-containing protein, partial [Mesorhizobium sp.]
MATASSVQREPSMEEILASIRRIIEDSDTGRKQPDEADELRQDLAPAPGAVRGTDMDAFRAELHAGVESRRPATLAEVQPQPSAEPATARMEPPARSVPVKAPATLAEVSARIAAEPVVPVARADAPMIAEATGTARAAGISGKMDGIVADWRRELPGVGEQAKAAVPMQEPAAESKIECLEDLATEPAFEPQPSHGSAEAVTAEMPV